jgi:queuine tRNA-ribosyltransferase
MAIQHALDSDIAMVLDECPPADAAPGVVEEAVRRSLLWAHQSLQAHRELSVERAVFAIVQGGRNGELRRQMAAELSALNFDGYALGGISVGENPQQIRETVTASAGSLPEHRPRYLMGVGDPASLVEAVALGVDQFDCVMQTRLGRHGTAFTSTGRFQAKAARNADLDEPLDADCRCEVCARHSRGYIRHLLQVGEPTASRLLSLHNVAWTIDLMNRMRAAIVTGTFDSLRRDVLTVWS